MDECTKKRTEDWWPCGCMKRNGGRLTHIKLNDPKLKKCRKCGVTFEEVQKLRQDNR